MISIKEILDELLAGYKNSEDLTGPDGIFQQIKKALIGAQKLCIRTKLLPRRIGA
ncbi:MAG: hypothetical protein WC647_17155 [Desulfomonilaceae bacterium]|jgi:hypothetical protein